MSLFKRNKKATPIIEEDDSELDVAQIAARAKELDLKTKKLSMQLYSGESRSAALGRGMSFKEVRQYQAGDDVRFIDWNVSARLGSTYSKVFEEEKELNIILLVDVSASNLFGTQTMSKKDQIANLCSVLAFAAVKENNKVGAYFFSDKMEKVIPSKKSHSHVLFLAKTLIGYQPSSARTDLKNALNILNGTVKQRSLVFIVSDFISDDFREALKVTARRHEVVGIQVYDKAEAILPNLGLVTLEDAETCGLLLVDASDAQQRRIYREKFDYRMKHVNDMFKECGAGLLQISTEDDYMKTIKEFFTRKK